MEAEEMQDVPSEAGRVVNPSTLVDRLFAFYGATNSQFRVRPLDSPYFEIETYEVRENESDGYRSSMKDLYVVDNSTEIFYDEPIAVVCMRRAPEKYETEWVSEREQDCWELFEPLLSHVWLIFGTDNTDDYYPSYVFAYTPRATPE